MNVLGLDLLTKDDSIFAVEKLMKNTQNKLRPKTDPYEVWQSRDGWRWAVLKKYQTPEKEATNPYARWFCQVTTPQNLSGDMGDVYVSTIKSMATKVQ